MAKQIYIDENGNPIEVSGTVNTAELLPISGNDPTDTKSYIDNLTDYSTSEKVVGKWIDNSLIYEKTIYLGNLPDNTSASIPHNISGLKFLIDFQGFGYITNSVYFPLPFVSSSPIYVAVSTTDITITTTSNRSTTQGYITLRYVKN